MTTRLELAPRRFSVLRFIRGTVAVLLSLNLIGSIFLAENALHLPDGKRPDMATESLFASQFSKGTHASSRFFQVHASDGAILSAWLFTPPHSNHAGVVLLHGVGDMWHGVLGQARFLLDAGYTVLAPDSRAHGMSGGKLITYGLLEVDDIRQWAGLLLRQSGIDRLYGAGQSMGAAVLLQSLARESQFRAIAADCPFATFEEIAFDRMDQFGLHSRLFSWPIVQAGFLYTRTRYGLDLRTVSPALALKSTRTPVLLIHGTADSNIPIRHSRELHADNPAATELWEVPGAEHVQCVSQAPVDYARRVTAFFAAHL